MPFVTTQLTIKRHTDELWMLDHPVIYQGQSETFEIPSGFLTDFASVPRIAVWLIPRYGKWTSAAILHDYLCGPGIRSGIVSPVDADGIFRRVLREQGVSPARRWLMWAGVRWSATTQYHRRPGWWSQALPTIGISLLALPLVVPPALVILLGLGIFHVVDVLTGGRKEISLKT
jgi:hypothetical protein